MIGKSLIFADTIVPYVLCGAGGAWHRARKRTHASLYAATTRSPHQYGLPSPRPAWISRTHLFGGNGIPSRETAG
jgi:hypothetical protein